jgi:hypothetical protein
MTEKKEMIKGEIDWQAFWEDPVFPSEEEREDLRELFRVHWNRPGLHKPFGPVDGSGNWENS